ncbi:MAG: histone deacetylase [Halopseudomonas sp.]
MKHNTPSIGVPLVYSHNYSIPWNPKHRFPMDKYRLLYELLQQRSIANNANTHISSPCPTEWLKLAHDSDYVDAFIGGHISQDALKLLGLPWSQALVTRTLTAVGGTLQACQLALKNGLACHLAGGTHHAFSDHGQGFCVFNDLAVAAMTLLKQRHVKRILILDCDVHQGDGSAHILRHESRCFTCSIHAQNNYPFDKQCSDLDVALANGTGDAEYLQMLTQTLSQLEQHKPFDLLIYDAGSDVHLDDRLGLLALSDDGIRKRDRHVIEWAQRLNLPTACVIGGGYDHDHQQLAQRHALLFETANAAFQKRYLSNSDTNE